MNNFIADSSFDDSLVKNKKVEANTEVEPATVSSPTINTI